VAFEITEECLACGVCMDECPVEAISEGDNIFIIDSNECTECGSCTEVCPNDAIIEG
jgi:ferredoxin